MNFSEYKNFVKNVVALPNLKQGQLLDATQADVLEAIRRLPEASGIDFLILGHIKLLQAQQHVGLQRTEFLTEGIKYCNKALNLLTKSEQEEQLFCLTTKAILNYLMATEVSLFERLDYHEQAVQDFKLVINDASEKGFHNYIPEATINLVNSIINIAELAPPQDAVNLLEEARSYLDSLTQREIKDPTLEMSYLITDKVLSASIGLYTSGDIGLSNLETALDGLEKLIGSPDIARNDLFALKLYLYLIDFCLVWHMIHGNANHLLTRARHNLYLIKLKAANSIDSLSEISINIYDREYLWLSDPSVKNALSLPLINLDLLRDTIGPLDRPILFARALIVTAWQQFAMQKEFARNTAKTALLTLWPGYEENQKIPYPEVTLPHYIIKNALLLINTPTTAEK